MLVQNCRRERSFPEGKETVEFGMSGRQEEGEGRPSLATHRVHLNSYADSCFRPARFLSVGEHNKETTRVILGSLGLTEILAR